MTNIYTNSCFVKNKILYLTFIGQVTASDTAQKQVGIMSTGYRPLYTLNFPVQCYGSGTDLGGSGLIQVDANGKVLLSYYTGKAYFSVFLIIPIAQ